MQVCFANYVLQNFWYKWVCRDEATAVEVLTINNSFFISAPIISPPDCI